MHNNRYDKMECFCKTNGVKCEKNFGELSITEQIQSTEKLNGPNKLLCLGFLYLKNKDYENAFNYFCSYLYYRFEKTIPKMSIDEDALCGIKQTGICIEKFRVQEFKQCNNTQLKIDEEARKEIVSLSLEKDKELQ